MFKGFLELYSKPRLVFHHKEHEKHMPIDKLCLGLHLGARAEPNCTLSLDLWIPNSKNYVSYMFLQEMSWWIIFLSSLLSTLKCISSFEHWKLFWIYPSDPPVLSCNSLVLCKPANRNVQLYCLLDSLKIPWKDSHSQFIFLTQKLNFYELISSIRNINIWDKFFPSNCKCMSNRNKTRW